jgi:hypothetical protein
MIVNIGINAHALLTFVHLSPLCESVVSPVLFYNAKDKNIIFAWS